MPFPHYTQHDAMDCGPTSLRIIAQFYGKSYSLQNLHEKCHIAREGVSLLGISDAAENIGFRTASIKATWVQLRKRDKALILAVGFICERCGLPICGASRKQIVKKFDQPKFLD